MNNFNVKLKQFLGLLLIFTVVVNVLKLYSINSLLVVITFIVIIARSGIDTFTTKFPYSLSTVFNLFVLIFLGVAPMVQYLEGISVWGGEPFRNEDYLKTNFLIILSLFVYKINYNRIITKRLKIFDYQIAGNVSSLKLLLISLVTSIYLYFLFNGDVYSLLLRSEYSESSVATGGISYLLNAFVIRPIPAICFLLYLYNRGNSFLISVVLFLLMLFTNFPTGMPRFAVAAFYIPLCFYYFKFLKKPLNFAFVLTFSLIFIFPFLNMFRTGVFSSLSLDFNMFNTGHFDSYQMFMRAVSRNYITWGLQILGVLLFFIPRSIWPSKPIGSGYFVAHAEGYSFDNISMNFLGEGYMNFGVLGVVIFAYILSYFNAKIDKKFWTQQRSTVFTIMYFELLGMEFIIMRGALLNIYPALVAYIFITFTIYKLVNLRFKRHQLS